MFPARIKALLLGLFLLFAILIKPSQSFATDSFYQNTNSDVPATSHYKAQVVLIDATSAIICQVIGVDIINPARPCLGIDPVTRKIGFMKAENGAPLNSAISGMGGLISMTLNIPIHTTDYVGYIASGFSVIKPAYAQATGFNNLSALLTLWKRVRDLTYLGFVLMFVLIGLGTMLRVKLDARTVMSIQNQIPKAVIYIILITFSYAIAGLLIDAMWVGTFTGVNLITDGITCTDGESLTKKGTMYLLDNPIHYVNRTLGCPFEVISGEGANKSTIFILGRVVGNTLGEIVSTTILSIFGNFSSIRCAWTDPDTYGNCIKLGFQEVISWIIGFVMMLAIIVAVFIQLMRVWINLLKAYLQIILYTILAPIWIIAGIIPNNTNFGFTVWVRKMLASLAIYPITIFLFLVAVVLASDAKIQNPNPTNGEVFIPPMIGNPGIADNMGFLLALGIILITPEVVNMTREMFKTSPSKYAPAAMAALGAGMGSAMSPVKKGWGALNKTDNAGNPSGPLAYGKNIIGGKILKGVIDKTSSTGRVGKAMRGWFDNSVYTRGNIIDKYSDESKKIQDAERKARATGANPIANVPDQTTELPAETPAQEDAAAAVTESAPNIAPNATDSTPQSDTSGETGVTNS